MKVTMLQESTIPSFKSVSKAVSSGSARTVIAGSDLCVSVGHLIITNRAYSISDRERWDVSISSILDRSHPMIFLCGSVGKSSGSDSLDGGEDEWRLQLHIGKTLYGAVFTKERDFAVAFDRAIDNILSVIDLDDEEVSLDAIDFESSKIVKGTGLKRGFRTSYGM